MAQAPVSTTILQDYAERFAGSLAMHERGRQVIPGGITHDGRFMKPFPPYIARAQGAYKWDVDGHRLIDYVMGHGSLLFGHNDPDILAAMQAQLPVGTHYGAGHEGEIRWAEEVSRLVPSAETVKFTGYIVAGGFAQELKVDEKGEVPGYKRYDGAERKVTELMKEIEDGMRTY